MLGKIKKDFKIGKLEKEKENFKTHQKELIIRGNQALPQTPPWRSNRREVDEDEEYFPPPPHFLEPASPRETFFFSDGSLSQLRKIFSNIAPLPSKPTIDNFGRPLTQITDEKNNTIAITPKRSVPKTEERNLSEQLQSIFPDVNETINEESETVKEKIEHLDEIINKVTNINDDQDKQKYLNLSFSQKEEIKIWFVCLKIWTFKWKYGVFWLFRVGLF